MELESGQAGREAGWSPYPEPEVAPFEQLASWGCEGVGVGLAVDVSVQMHAELVDDGLRQSDDPSSSLARQFTFDDFAGGPAEPRVADPDNSAWPIDVRVGLSKLAGLKATCPRLDVPLTSGS